nr:RGG repeats nuclear RNA binding protein A-like [Ipomoea batatas]
MATMNPFDLLGDDDNDDPSQLLAAQQQKLPPSAPAAKKGPAQAQPAKPASAAAAKMPSKPLPPAEAGGYRPSEEGEGGRPSEKEEEGMVDLVGVSVVDAVEVSAMVKLQTGSALGGRMSAEVEQGVDIAICFDIFGVSSNAFFILNSEETEEPINEVEKTVDTEKTN